MTDQLNRNALPNGSQLFWYRIEGVLGQGGFGLTYRAYDTNLQRDVAIKEYLPSGFAVRDGSHTLHPMSGEYREHYQWGLKRFLAEARVLARFNHPNIVRVLSVFEANNTAYMVMEYEAGESLFALLRQRGVVYTEPEASQIALTLMSGLESVHASGFIHRDVKPGNILIRSDGHPVLIDFGSARYAMGGRTQMLTAVVSPGYAPYEQYEGSGERQGPWTDIYGLGATLYVMASGGKPPVDAIGRGNARIQGTADPYRPASIVGSGRFSRRFLQAIDAALGFTREERPESVAAWRELFPQTGIQAPWPQPRRRGGLAALRSVFTGLRGVMRFASMSRTSLDEDTGVVSIPVSERTSGLVFRDATRRGGPSPEMVVVPAGEFTMGDDGAGSNERPMHKVIIGADFGLGVAPVTQEDYRRFAAAAGARVPDDLGWEGVGRPVINVSWREAKAYTTWLAEETGLPYRLPSEAEWEYAARAGSSTRFWWGDEAGNGYANCDGCGSEWDNLSTSPVGSFPANPFGLVDMLGNVWEWVEDAWHQNYTGAPLDGSAWHEGSQTLRVARGGAWNYEPRHARSACRVGYTVDHRSRSLGFRVALTL